MTVQNVSMAASLLYFYVTLLIEALLDFSLVMGVLECACMASLGEEIFGQQEVHLTGKGQ